MWLAPAGEAPGTEEEVGEVEEGSAGPAAKQFKKMKWAIGPCKQEDLLKEIVLASGFSLQALQVGRRETGKCMLLMSRHAPASIAASAVGTALTASALGAARVCNGCCRQRPGCHGAKAEGLLAAWPQTHFAC